MKRRIRVLAWLAAWGVVVISTAYLPLWGSVALAIGVFAAQVFLGPRAACHVPEGVTRATDRGR
jgi:ABC-type Co2+ transport system permease subunit